MPELISATEIAAMSDETWTGPQEKRAENLLAGINGWIRRNAPCLVVDGADDDVLAEGKEIVAEAMLRAIAAGTGNVATQGIGPDSVGYIDRAALPTLTSADKDRLRELCPASSRRARRVGTIRTRPGY